jgi:hypothetical protein
MGQSKGGGYTQKQTLLPEQMQSLLSQLTSGQANTQAAAAGFKDLLPGGTAGSSITNQAQNNFRQQTVPNILQAFGQGSKGGTGLNQALASSGADLNTNLASMLAQMQLGASQGLGGLGQGQQQQGIQTPGFAYLQKQPPLWQQLLQTGLGVAGPVAQGWVSRPQTTNNYNTGGPIG